MDRDHLHGIKLKLKRAQQQIQALKTDIDAFHKHRPYGIGVQFDPNTRTLALIAKVWKPYDPMWGIRAGEVVHHLRSSLDHLVWELVFHKTKGPPPKPKATKFPIHLTLEGDDGYGKNAGRAIAGVSSEAAALIERSQPFSTGDGVANPLWALHGLSNLDKHRTIALTSARMAAANLKFRGLAPGVKCNAVLRPGPFKHDTVCLSLRFPGTEWPFAGPVSKVKVEGPFSFGVAFDKGRTAEENPASDLPVVPVLRVLHRRVTEIIQQFAKEIFRV
jgi:hypothetical protein